MARIDQIADGLADEVARDRITGEPVVAQQFPFFFHIGLAGGSGIGVEMIAPTGEFKPVVAHFVGQRGEFFERQIGPLAGKQCDRS